MNTLLTVVLLVVLIPLIIILGSTLFDALLGLSHSKEPVSRYREEEDEANEL